MRLNLYPLTFAPVFKDYTWGGRKLGDVLDRDIPEGQVAESWEVSAHPNGPTAVANGDLAGRSLAELLDEYGVALVGRRNRAALDRGRFPLLVKFLDAYEWLSIQVHPNDEHALAHEGDFGKTEMWIVLQADPGAELLLGFNRDVEPHELESALRNGDLPSLMDRVAVEAGDAFFVPAGTVHALGPGTLLAEIQQSSDTTYRLYDWGRQADGGRERPLHIEEGLQATNFAAIRPGAVHPELLRRDGQTIELLANCPYFQTERITLEAGQSYSGRCAGETFELWCVLSGEVRLDWAGEAVELPSVRWVLLPAELGRYEVTAGDTTKLLRVLTPTPS